MSYDLILQASALIPAEVFDRVCLHAMKLPALARCECYRGKLPDALELAELIEDEEVSRDEYVGFCASQGLDKDAAASAQAFLIQHFGITVLSVHLPKDDELVAEALQECLYLTQANGLTLHDPQAGEDLPVGYSGKYPPLY